MAQRVSSPSLWLTLLVSVCSLFSSQAQSNRVAQAQDPLMSLMLSQPKIDVDSQVQPNATFDPPVVRPGETATYRVTVNALEASTEWPETLPAPPQLQVQAGGRGQILAMAGPTLQPRTTFNYRVSASATGHYTIPEFTITVYGKRVTIPAAQLEVAPTVPPGQPPMQQLVLEFPTTNLFVGQAVRARILGPAAQGLGQVQIHGQGVVVDQTSARQQVEVKATRPGLPPVQTLVYDLLVIPIASGKLPLFAQGYAIARGYFAGVIIGGASTQPNATPQYILLDSPPVDLTVRPLPREGELPGFTGAVGTFGVDPPELSTNTISVGEPLQLKVKVHGTGNVARLVAPPPPVRLKDWHVLPPSLDNTPPQFQQAQGFTTFHYTLVALSAKATQTPAIPFSCFDPQTASYVDLTIPPAPIQVIPGATPPDPQILAQADALEAKAEKEPVLSGLAAAPGWSAASLMPLQRQLWFPLMQVIPAAALAGLLVWDRRRRFREQHPDWVLRRRARRALRRERRLLRKAARSGNGAGFASAAVSAMRVACSPHYPAEPRALVGSDVLAVLPPAERSGRSGEVVRQFFTVSDASRFGAGPANLGELLAWQPELERTLEQLEAKLCEDSPNGNGRPG